MRMDNIIRRLPKCVICGVCHVWMKENSTIITWFGCFIFYVNRNICPGMGWGSNWFTPLYCCGLFILNTLSPVPRMLMRTFICDNKEEQTNISASSSPAQEDRPTKCHKRVSRIHQNVPKQQHHRLVTIQVFYVSSGKNSTSRRDGCTEADGILRLLFCLPACPLRIIDHQPQRSHNIAAEDKAKRRPTEGHDFCWITA